MICHSGSQVCKEQNMNEDDEQHVQGADDRREGEGSDRSLPVSEGPHIALEGKGS